MLKTMRRINEQARQYVIYGDIGGTKTLLQVAEHGNGTTQTHDLHRYHSGDYHSFSDILSEYLNKIGLDTLHSNPVAACFAVAGPIVSQRVQLTNLPWLLDAAEISRLFSISQVKLLNDFEAAASAIDILPSDDLVILQSGHSTPRAMRVVLGAGTGMGVAWLVWQQNGYQPLSTEAGHIDFAPTNALQIQLLEALQKKFHHVSIERLLSGAGLTNIFKFLQENLTEFSNLVPIQLDEDDGAVITTLANEQHHPIAIRSLALFAEIYGAYAGNLALAGLCKNGVYIAGGIAPKIINTFLTGGFMQAFRNKGRFSDLMMEIPVQVVTHSNISLLGAQRSALELLQTSTNRNSYN